MAEETKICTSCGRRFGDEALFCPRDGSALVPASNAGQGKDPFIGRDVLGHIEIESLIGSGAMGRVYRAFQRGIERDVAVKILHKDLAQNPDLVQRFLREAKVASRLNHPNVVQVLLAGQLDDGTMYLVMEYLDGISLHSALLAAGGALPLTRALHVGLQVCDAVGQAHEAGVVHRDVKPENVMLVSRGDDLDFVKVLDFGIARVASNEGGRSGLETQAGLVFGTARYLSPEGARGEPVGPQSDCYAIATVLYQTLAGRTPFESDSSVSLLVAQIHDAPPPLRSHPRSANVPPAIEAVILRNLAKDPKSRDADAHVFGRALLDAALQSGLSADDLILRPAVARRRGGSGGSLPAASLGAPVLSATGQVTPPPGLQRPLASTQTALAPAQLATPHPSPAGAPEGIYHPSDSGRPAPDLPSEPRRVAKTLDDELLAPPPAPPAQLLGAGTVAMPPAPEDSILGAASSREDLSVPAGVPRRGRLAPLLLVVALVGVGGLGVGAYRLGYLGPKPGASRASEVEDLLARARAALDARRWDAPPGENVLELTEKLLALAPAETRTFQIRNAAADRIVREALDRKAHDDFAQALALYKLAAKLSPPDKGLEEEIEEVEAQLAKDPATAGLVTDAGAAKFTATLKIGGDDAPKPNEATSIVAVIEGDKPKGTDPKAHFTISGPGLDKPRSIGARADSPTRYVASFVFPQAGTYKVKFLARPDDFPLSIDGERVVGSAGTTAPAPKPTGLTPSPKPTGTWPGTWPTGPVGPAPTSTGPGKTLTPDPIPLPPPTTGLGVPPPPFPTP